MSVTGLCFACEQPILIVATNQGTRSLEPTPDPKGTVEIRPSGLGYRGRSTGSWTPLTVGWTAKHRSHSCEKPKEAS